MKLIKQLDELNGPTEAHWVAESAWDGREHFNKLAAALVQAYPKLRAVVLAAEEVDTCWEDDNPKPGLMRDMTRALNRLGDTLEALGGE